ncbi:coiled-coil domain-containing protein 42 homolog isoform X2 [Latimeria chalumnae]|uniref:coiled-coil domain-containing protein 42 homolog isoform X2 n=1 Tax=Latimeria chalumnae TaxID=7897 RepID=UPI00313B0EA4
MNGVKRSLAVSNADPRFLLQVENRRKFVFVTQLGEKRDEENENIKHVPVITEAADKILDAGINTLQRTRVLKKIVEVNQVDAELNAKKEEHRKRMEVLALKREELEKKKQAYEELVLNFDKFLRDNEAKRIRATQNYQKQVKENKIKESEKNGLVQDLEKLRIRQQMLHERVAKCKIFEDFLLHAVERLPQNYLEFGADSAVMALIKRYDTLRSTNEILLSRLASLSDELEKSQHHLETLDQRHNTTKLMINTELSELQMKYDKVQKKNKQSELKINVNKGYLRSQTVELGSLLMAVANLADQCHLKHYGPLHKMDLTSKLDMIKAPPPMINRL